MIRDSFVLPAHCGHTSTDTLLNTLGDRAAADRVGELVCAGFIVTSAGRLLRPDCACARDGHRYPPVPRACTCKDTKGHPRTPLGRCAARLWICLRCKAITTSGVIPAARKAVA